MNNNNSQLHWYDGMWICLVICPVSWGGGVGHGTDQVGGLLLCSGIQARRLYATTPASNVGMCVDGGQ